MEKKKIVFLDSDGTIMDSMKIKHEKALAPCLIDAFGLESHKDKILSLWYKENLYSIKRGLNRFDALLSILEYVNSNIGPVTYLDIYKKWLDSTISKSLKSLEEYMMNNNYYSLMPVINWAINVNKCLEEIESEIKPFKGIDKVLSNMKDKYIIIIVSTANRKSLEDEWSKYKFLDYVDDICSQEIGTKEYCIDKMKEKYNIKDAIMIGDSIVDYNAAKKNNIYFYPIIQNEEEDNWNDWNYLYSEKFYNDEYVFDNVLLEKYFLERLNSK